MNTAFSEFILINEAFEKCLLRPEFKAYSVSHEAQGLTFVFSKFDLKVVNPLYVCLFWADCTYSVG